MAEAAPLYSTPEAPVPAGAAAEWFAGAGRARLRAALFAPTGPPRGSVVVSPGRTEPIEKYFEVVERLAGRGFWVLVHDWRGHGLSLRPAGDTRGHARGWRDFMADYAALLAAFEARLPKPWIALGHSMGGCLTLLALAQGEARFSAAILSAPMLGLHTGAIPRPIARVMAAAMTALGKAADLASREPPAPDSFQANILTHDPVRYQRNLALVTAHPDLMVGPPTWGWLDFAFTAIAELERGAGAARIALPLTVATAGEERLVDNEGLARVTTRVPGAKFLTIPGAYHEILQETDPIQDLFWAEFDALAAQADVR
ncbi:MAG TPA: alpha/beta hydrolase [Caulobacteraceae bacterium]|nr:alpha/beta hydrolase [Caulobacteraceae bacterium]